ncbi:hypothetical protein DQ241_05095 [Blastococcus sp. TF02A-30]|nr:hypothetical protein DQ241_05095 [Blastococcus sp. TF02A-30]
MKVGHIRSRAFVNVDSRRMDGSVAMTARPASTWASTYAANAAEESACRRTSRAWLCGRSRRLTSSIRPWMRSAGSTTRLPPSESSRAPSPHPRRACSDRCRTIAIAALPLTRATSGASAPTVAASPAYSEERSTCRMSEASSDGRTPLMYARNAVLGATTRMPARRRALSLNASQAAR